MFACKFFVSLKFTLITITTNNLFIKDLAGRELLTNIDGNDSMKALDESVSSSDANSSPDHDQFQE